MTYFDHYYGRPLVSEMSDEALLDEAVGVEMGAGELVSEDDLSYAAEVRAEVVRRDIGARIGELVREIRDTEAYIAAERLHLEATRYWNHP